MALLEKKIGRVTVKVDYDDCAESPREWDDLSTIYSAHRRYSPDNHSIDEILDEDGNLITDGKVCLAVWMFEHSGCSFETAELGEGNPFGNGMYARFDSGQFGVIAMSIKDAKREWGKNYEERAKNWMEGCIEDYDKWQRGEVYRWSLVDEDGEEIESVGGWYDENEALSEGVSVAKAYVEREIQEVENMLENATFDELKSKYYEMATPAPLWADEVLGLVEEGKAKEWLKKKLREMIGEESDWIEVL
ncbi:MAG: hypothetical protein J6X18_00680 [Bacteroidales bacterium]|nr:hypothetical protein [Bacteroidales bacterium]